MMLAIACLLAFQSIPPSVAIRSEPQNPERVDGTVELALEVTEKGLPDKVRVVRSLGLASDQAAIDAVRQWRFRPAMRGGKPIRVTAKIEISFRYLKAWRVGEEGVTAPKLIERVEPVASNPEISGTVTLYIEVTEEGRAEKIRILRSLDPTLDRDAIDTVKKWKFEPGTKDGVAARVASTVEVNFRRR